MFALLATLSWAQTADCDVDALSKVITEEVGDQVTESFISLSSCSPNDAKKIAEKAIVKFYPGTTGNKGIIAAAQLELYSPIQQWLDNQLPGERSEALRDLGSECSQSTQIQGFFLEQANSNAEKFWSDRWYRFLDQCSTPEVIGLLKARLDLGADQGKSKFFGVLTTYARAAGKDAIPTLKGLIEKTDDAEEKGRFLESFADAARVGSVDGMDKETAALAVKTITELGDSIKGKPAEQARAILQALDDEAAADSMAAYRYADVLQKDNTLLWAVVVVEDVVCKKKPKQRIHYTSIVDKSKNTWPRQLEDKVKANYEGYWKFDLAKRCKGEQFLKVVLPNTPFADEKAMKAWTTDTIANLRNPEIKPKKIKEVKQEPIEL
ncbi:MAG: hypothetical protein VX278_21960 [Myxococcota bacterium]|nr:hypothetical protein [Myxococcota bacterium]